MVWIEDDSGNKDGKSKNDEGKNSKNDTTDIDN